MDRIDIDVRSPAQTRVAGSIIGTVVEPKANPYQSTVRRIFDGRRLLTDNDMGGRLRDMGKERKKDASLGGHRRKGSGTRDTR